VTFCSSLLLSLGNIINFYILYTLNTWLTMSVIRVSKNTKIELLRYASELQIKLGRKVDFDEAIAHLLKEARKKRPELLMEACSPIKEAEELISELYRERGLDEGRAKRKYGI